MTFDNYWKEYVEEMKGSDSFDKFAAMEGWNGALQAAKLECLKNEKQKIGVRPRNCNDIHIAIEGLKAK